MSKLEWFLIAIILLGIGGTIYVTHRPEPPVVNTEQIYFKHKIDSLLNLDSLQKDSIVRFNVSLKELKDKKDSVRTRWVRERVVVAGADERELDSLILKYSE